MVQTEAEQNLFLNPVFRYGVCAVSAIILLAVGFLFLEGLAQFFVFFLAAVELLIMPQFLKWAGEAETEPQAA